jgi:Flp pilus assembly protein TadD
MRQRLTFLLGIVLLTTVAGATGFAQQNSNLALLIGNAAYPDADAPLKEPVTDARALGDELRHRGFDVDIGENLKKEAMQRALDRFYGKINSSSTVLIFFSGFGIQSDRQSYMIPVDAQIWNEGDVRRDGFSLDKVLAELTSKGASVKVGIIDASRRNPFERRFRSVSAGLAAVTVPKGTVVMTSAPSDTVVNDGSTPVFMNDFITELKAPGATIEQTFNKTRIDVSRDTKGQQVPWFSSSLEQDIVLGSPAPSVAAAPPPPPVAAPPPAPPPVAAQSKPNPPAPVVSQPKSNAPAAAAKPAQPSAPPAVAAAKPAAPQVATSSPDPEAPARHDYVATENVGTQQAWDDFVKKYPTGVYHDLALQQIAKLPPAASSTTAAPDEATPHDMAGYYRRGQHYAVAGNYPLAIKDFNDVIRLDPGHAGALNNRCWVRAVTGDLQAALKDCNEALRIAPDYPDALDSRGMVYLKLGLLREAVADYDAALRLDPKHASSLYGRGIAEMRRGDSAGGKSDIDAAKDLQSSIADEFASYGIR